MTTLLPAESFTGSLCLWELEHGREGILNSRHWDRSVGAILIHSASGFSSLPLSAGTLATLAFPGLAASLTSQALAFPLLGTLSIAFLRLISYSSSNNQFKGCFLGEAVLDPKLGHVPYDKEAVIKPYVFITINILHLFVKYKLSCIFRRVEEDTSVWPTIVPPVPPMWKGHTNTLNEYRSFHHFKAFFDDPALTPQQKGTFT